MAAFCLAASGAWSPAAAQSRAHYELGVSEIYSQDVLRTGDNSIDDYITGLTATGLLDVKTARSTSLFSYTPTYYSYYELTDLDHLDHHYRGDWSFHPGQRSTFRIQQGYSENTRQSGFTDLDGAGSDAGQPVIGLTRRRSWEIAPEWSLDQTPRTSVALRSLFRSEAYDRDDLIDSQQYALESALAFRVGRAQRLGGRVRGDHYRYPDPQPGQATGFDNFLTAQVTWAMAVIERFEISAGAGAFRAGGPDVDSVLGPTADLTGAWKWRRSGLAIGYGLGFSSGGGLATAERSSRGDVAYDLRWGRGFASRLNGTFIRRRQLETEGAVALQGRSFGASIEKTWLSGCGIGVEVTGLRQEEQVGADLDYGEATFHFLYRQPVPPERPVPPPTEPNPSNPA
jgi:hypothetical protein